MYQIGLLPHCQDGSSNTRFFFFFVLLFCGRCQPPVFTLPNKIILVASLASQARACILSDRNNYILHPKGRENNGRV